MEDERVDTEAIQCTHFAPISLNLLIIMITHPVIESDAPSLSSWTITHN
jgi:hypothetical protein